MMRPKLTYANVMATVAVFIALGGASYAAFKLPKNSVGSKQLKKNAVTTAKIKREAVTAGKVKKGTLTGKQINASTLGTVPTASGLTPLEAVHVVGASGEPPFLGGTTNFGPVLGVNAQPVGFYKDHEGIVHLVGLAKVGAEPLIFALPPGFRPASGVVEIFPGKESVLFVLGSNVGAAPAGTVIAFGAKPGEAALLSGATFRAGS